MENPQNGGNTDLAVFPRPQDVAARSSPKKPSYKDTVAQGDKSSFAVQHSNPTFVPKDEEEGYETEDDAIPEDDDPECPTIALKAEEKHELWRSWKDTLIIRLFDKGPGFMTLRRRLSKMGALSSLLAYRHRQRHLHS
ncbi:hypothetical protein V2J09_000480 [Rumex salicifolius]